LQTTEKIKICDFGFTRTNDRDSNMTIAGSDKYMAPEVICGEKYNEKCDVFGFGVVLFEVVAQRRPPKRGPATAYGFAPNELERLIPLDCPAKLAQLVLHCCTRTPSDRPDFGEILDMLRDLQREFPEPLAATSSGSTPPQQPQPKSNNKVIHLSSCSAAYPTALGGFNGPRM